jgi:hypothetical protein
MILVLSRLDLKLYPNYGGPAERRKESMGRGMGKGEYVRFNLN